MPKGYTILNMIYDSRIKIVIILTSIWIALLVLANAYNIPLQNTIFGIILAAPIVVAIALLGFVLSDYYKYTKKLLSGIFKLFSILYVLVYIIVLIIELISLLTNPN